MKQLAGIAVFALVMLFWSGDTYGQCDASQFKNTNLRRMPQGFTFEKEFDIKSDQLNGSGQVEYVESLSSGTLYLLNISNYRGEEKNLIVELYDNNGLLVATNYNKNTDRYYPLGYACRQSGQYKLVFKFNGTEQQCGLGVLALRK